MWDVTIQVVKTKNSKSADRAGSALKSELGARLFGVWIIVFGLLAFLIFILLPRKPASGSDFHPADKEPGSVTGSGGLGRPQTPLLRRPSTPSATSTAEELVAAKVSEFGRQRRDVAQTMAARAGFTMPPEVQRFFDAVELGKWEEITNRFAAIDGHGPEGSSVPKRSPEVQASWPAILDAFGAAEAAHQWPAQKLLDYGNTVLDSLRPGMAYFGGTDPGRWIPGLLNDTTDGERHVILTQNGLADNSYRDYAALLYPDQVSLPTQADSDRIFQDYMADARKRLEHDQQHPDEPKQVLPGENISITDDRLEVSGQSAVMAINEKLLQAILQKNPDLSFAMEESFPLKSTYADATALGPILELRAAGGAAALTPDTAAQIVDYWRAASQQILSGPDDGQPAEALKTYSHDAVAQANLLSNRGFDAEAEQGYRIASELWPDNPESVAGLSETLAREGRADEARQLLADFAGRNPDQRSALESSAAWHLLITPH